jgi:hypothetical protein
MASVPRFEAFRPPGAYGYHVTSGKEKTMLHAEREGPRKEARPGPAVRTRDGELTEFLLDVLESAESYDAHILQATRDEDPELVAFLRELRRQDVVRTSGVVRLLRRPPGERQRYPEEGIGA